MSRSIPADLQTLLSRWNGLELEVVRVHGVAPTEAGIFCLNEGQSLVPANVIGGLAFASDPAGYLYMIDAFGAILSFDHDGGETRQVATTLDEFFASYVFGSRVVEFGGPEWAAQIAACGL